jgi:hypothetical protein
MLFDPVSSVLPYRLSRLSPTLPSVAAQGSTVGRGRSPETTVTTIFVFVDVDVVSRLSSVIPRSGHCVTPSSSSLSSLSFLVAVVLWRSHFNQGYRQSPAVAKALCRGRGIEAPSSTFIVDDGAVRVLRNLHCRCSTVLSSASSLVFVVWSSSSLLALDVGSSECT